MTYQVKNRFQSLPFKCNLQRYTTGASLAFTVTLRDWLGRSATATASTRKSQTPALAVAVAVGL